MSLPIIDLAGEPFEMGLAHGRMLADSIKENFSAYLKMIGVNTGRTPENIVALARKFIPELESNTPDLLGEMNGIAQGADVPLETILVLNCRTELAYLNQPVTECTAIGLTKDRTKNGKVLLAQNWDWISAVKSTTAFFRIRPKDGPRALMMAEAGQVGKLGFNEEGLGLLLNLLITGNVQIAIPIHVMLRQLMRAATVAEAADLVKNIKCASSSHILIGDVGGRVLGLEMSPAGVAPIEPKKGVVVHTNHFCDPSLSIYDRGMEIGPDTTTRLQQAQDLLDSREKWDENGIKKILGDHHNHPSSICRHINPEEPEAVRLETLVSLIYDLENRQAWVAHGQPCRAEYVKVVL